jgi:hypothetical protein
MICLQRYGTELGSVGGCLDGGLLVGIPINNGTIQVMNNTSDMTGEQVMVQVGINMGGGINGLPRGRGHCGEAILRLHHRQKCPI